MSQSRCTRWLIEFFNAGRLIKNSPAIGARPLIASLIAEAMERRANRIKLHDRMRGVVYWWDLGAKGKWRGSVHRRHTKENT